MPGRCAVDPGIDQDVIVTAEGTDSAFNRVHDALPCGVEFPHIPTCTEDFQRRGIVNVKQVCSGVEDTVSVP